MNNFGKNILLWVAILVTLVLLYGVYSNYQEGPVKELKYDEFRKLLESKAIATATVKGTAVRGEFNTGSRKMRFTTVIPEGSSAEVADELYKSSAKVNVEPIEKDSWLSWIFSLWLPILIFIGFWVFIMRQMQGSGNKALSFGKSKAKLLTSQQKKSTFKDAAGVDEAKEELSEVVEFLMDPQKFQKLGGRIPKGVLLVGSPGTGKTLLARSVAGEANVPFFSISGSDFVEMFVGVGASRVRDLFEQGKKNAPCIIFIDEIDAVGRHRGAGLGGGHDEREQTLNQLLVEMDGFESNEGVILIAATNRPDVLDPALLRPGRFDRQVIVNLPDVKGRLEILKVHTEKIPLNDDVDLNVIARSSPGFSGAQLANMVNEAALNAARYSKKNVSMADFETAKDKVLMGKERRSLTIREDEKRTTAFHEAGHAILAAMLPDADPIHKVGIIPRGMALGVTQQLPENDRYNYSQKYLEAQLKVLMGGRAAEEIFLGVRTTGASNDIERATEMARKMVCEWGMSEKLGPLTFGKKDEQIFLGRELSRAADYSEDTAIVIDLEIQRIVRESFSAAEKLIRENSGALERIAAALLEYEVLEADEVRALLAGQPIRQEKPPSSAGTPSDGLGESIPKDGALSAQPLPAAFPKPEGTPSPA